MAWYDEAVFYHIYPLGLLGAEKTNSYGEVNHRLRNLDPWVKHIKDTGFNAIYIGPLFESVGHGYETTDYRKLDSRLGDNKDLKDFVKKCHDNGIRVIFDGVFNHTGRDFFAFQDIKNNRENSRYRDWYCNVNFWGNNEYNDGFSYDNWGGYNLLVKLNQRNPEVRDYIADVIRFWVSEFDVDGIRLDAADVLDFDFMKMLRWVASEVKPDFWLMGEVIHGEYSRWVNDGTLHSVTNYHLHKALYSGHNEHNYFEIAHTVRRLYQMSGNNPNGLKLYNFTDNHDVERIYTKLHNKAHYAPAHILSYTLPGIPSMYYGSEFGIEGRKERGSDDSLRPYLNLDDFRNALENNENTKLIRKLGLIRQNVHILAYGDYREAVLTNRQYAYVRTLDWKSVVVAVNNDDNGTEIHVNNIPDGEYVAALSGERIQVMGGHICCRLGGNSGEIYIPSDVYDAIKWDEKKVIKSTAKKKPAKVTKESKKEEPKVTEPVKVSEPLKPEVKEEIKATIKKSAKKMTETVAKAKKEVAPKEPEAQVVTESICAPSIDEKEEAVANSAAKKYNLDSKYDKFDTVAISFRCDYDNMCMEELQVAILEKMAKNGPVNEQMVRTVMENVYMDSLKNWVKSFR